MSTYYHQTERNEWFRGDDDLPTTSKHTDDTIPYTLDYSDMLNSGETISTSTWEADGPTLTSGSIASGLGGSSKAAQITVNGHGKAKNTIVTSSSRTIVRSYRWEALLSGDVIVDYD